MSSSPRPRAAGHSPPPPAPSEAVPSTVSASPSEQHPVKEEAEAAAAAAADVEQEVKSILPWGDDTEEEIQEHEQKINRYQAILAARLKAKYFSKETFHGGDVFEEETTIEGQTIRSSRWPCTSSFADPAKFLRDNTSSEKNNSPSVTAVSSAKNDDAPSVAAEASAKANSTSLAAENSLTPGKKLQSKKTAN